MSRRTTALAAALSLLPLGQPLLLGTLGITTATTAVLLQAPPAVAQDVSAVARIAKAITVRIEGATQGSGVLVKKDGTHRQGNHLLLGEYCETMNSKYQI